MWPPLPNELWLKILADCCQSDVAPLSQTCKHLNLLMEPLLYSKFSWIPDQRSISCQGLPHQPVISVQRCQLNKTCSQVHLLLRTLLNRPSLAFHLKSAEFISPLSTDEDPKNIFRFWRSENEEESGFSQRDFELANTIVREMELHAQDDWMKFLRNGRSDVIVALLLSRLSQIKSLDIRLRTSQYQPPIVGEKLLDILNPKPCYGGSPRFRNLKSVSLSIDRDESGRQACSARMVHLYRFDRQVAPLFSLPSVETLDVAWIYPESPMGPSPVPLAQNLKSLRIRDSVIDEHTLGILLRGTPGLEILQCELKYDQFRNQKCDSEALKCALDQVAATLKTLIIGVHVVCHGQLVDDWNIAPNSMGSMTHFQELRHLAVPLILLVDSPNIHLAEVLPDQLETFEVGWADSRLYIEQVEEQLIEYLDGSPALQSIKVDSSKDWSENFRDILSNLPGNRDGDINTVHQVELVLI